VDLGGSAIVHARSVFLARNSKIKNKIFGGAALILGAGGDDKHKYFFYLPLSMNAHSSTTTSPMSPEIGHQSKC
jgi:hypothetical protein